VVTKRKSKRVMRIRVVRNFILDLFCNEETAGSANVI